MPGQAAFRTQDDRSSRRRDETIEVYSHLQAGVVLDDRDVELPVEQWIEKGTEGREGNGIASGGQAYKLTSPMVFPGDPVERPKPSVAKSRFRLLQQWEGCVLEVHEESFTSIVHDQTDPNNSPEEVELSIEDVPPNDRRWLVTGAIFYWSIGYNDLANGQRLRSSIINFRRMPAWRERDIEKMKNKASRLSSFLKSNHNDPVQDVASE